MAINPQYMISPNLQEVFLDKDTGLPLSGGFVFYYKDKSRSDLKAIYELSGTYTTGYTYTLLPNPLELSVIGTPINGAGQDIRVYYYPFDDNGEPDQYYIVVKSTAAVTQSVRQNWPPQDSSIIPFASSNSYNFVRNGTFYSWSNGISFSNVGIGSVDYLDFMPDDWTYEQGDPTQTIAISRGTFSIGANPIAGDNPPFYFNYANTAVGSGTGTYNRLTQHYKSVKTLSSQQITISFWAMKVTPSTTADMSISVTQFFGSGSGAPTPNFIETPIGAPIPGASITNSWTQFTVTGTVPNAGAYSSTIGTSGNDALILNINFPLNVTQNISIDKIVIQIGESISTTSQEISNDDIQKNTDAIGLYPAFTTSDAKITLKNVADTGWLMMDDSTIGSPLSGATHVGFKYYNLFNLIWSNVHSTVWAPIFTSLGVITTYGGSFQSDWAANTRLSLTKVLGRALCGTGQSIIMKYLQTTSTGNNLSVDNISIFYTGTTFTISAGAGGVLPTGLFASTTYFATNINLISNTIQVSNSLANAVAGIFLTISGGTLPVFITVSLTNEILGSYAGEFFHSSNISEEPSHNHGIGGGGQFIGTGAGGSNYGDGSRTTTTSSGTLFTGGSNPHNNTQPSSFWNVMIKL